PRSPVRTRATRGRPRGQAKAAPWRLAANGRPRSVPDDEGRGHDVGAAGTLVDRRGDRVRAVRDGLGVGGVGGAVRRGTGEVPGPRTLGLAGGPAHLRVIEPEAHPGDPARRG